MWIYLLYVGAGVLIDILVTALYIAIEEKRPLMVCMLSTTSTIVGYMITYYIFFGPGFFLHLLCYALGGGVGAGITVWYKKKTGLTHKE